MFAPDSIATSVCPARDGQRAGGLRDRSVVFEDVLDGHAGFVGPRGDHLVDVKLGDAPRLSSPICGSAPFADTDRRFHGDAVGEHTDAL